MPVFIPSKGAVSENSFNNIIKLLVEKLSDGFFTRNRDAIFLFFIIITGSFLRFYKIDWQSLWLDELYTLKAADPAISWGETARLVLAYENKSPLYFFVIKGACILFGYTSQVARGVSAIGGIIGIYAVYLLGRQLFDKRTGLIAALITCVNPFLIFYSQEARSYIFIFLFTVLSFLFYAKSIKDGDLRSKILCGVSNLILLYLHPFGLLTVFAQFIMGVILLVQNKERKNLVNTLLICGGMIIIGFLPLVPSLLKSTSETSIWILPPQPGFFVDYFYEFFGNSDLLKPFLFTGLIGYLVFCFNNTNTRRDSARLQPDQIFVFFLITLLSVFLISYLVSFLKLPVLVIRYTIIALPVYLLIISAGFSLIPSRIAGNTLLTAFAVVSLLELFVFKEFYIKPVKTQFREMTGYIHSNNANQYPIVNNKTAWQQLFYLSKNSMNNELLQIPKEQFAQNIFAGDSLKYEGFWLVGAHIDPKLPDEITNKLKQKYLMLRSKDFYDAWAQLYIKAPDTTNTLKIDTRYFDKKNVGLVEGDTVITLWEGEFRESNPVNFSPGYYKMTLLSWGSPYEGVFPHINVFINNEKAGSYYVSNQPDYKTFSVLIPQEGPVVIKLRMDNDKNDQGNGKSIEDRNAFVKFILFQKQDK